MREFNIHYYDCLKKYFEKWFDNSYWIAVATLEEVQKNGDLRNA
jgi:hypothetical protein